MFRRSAENEVAPAQRGHWSSAVEVDFSAAGHGRGCIAEERCAAQSESLSARHGSARGDRVADKGEHAGTYVKAAGEGKEIVVCLDAFEIQLTVVGDAIFMEGAAVTEDVEAGADIGSMADACRHLES